MLAEACGNRIPQSVGWDTVDSDGRSLPRKVWMAQLLVLHQRRFWASCLQNNEWLPHLVSAESISPRLLALIIFPRPSI